MSGKSLEFNRVDKQHLTAAESWLELGNHVEADAELDQITPELRARPNVLKVRWEIYAAAKKWEAALDIAAALIQMEPEDALGWVHRSYALHELKRTKQNSSSCISFGVRVLDNSNTR